MVRGFAELCCDVDSALGRLSPAYGYEHFRVAETLRFDLPRGLAAACAFLDASEAPTAWAALPCTSWCTWTFLNAKRLGPEYCARLGYARRRSIRMVGHAETCLAKALSRGGDGHFEWPRRARGWQRRRVRRMLAALNLECADFDGCCFNARGSGGLLAQKPWRLATSRPDLALALRAKRCPGTHLHGHLSGRFATQSGHYTDEMCHFVWASCRSHVHCRTSARRSLRSVG